ncbi:MAG: UBP-type zinc finger domain-containing protein, partial [archaeon]|nr:UBP-type zinc finger domain-containing protein [archaeon]
MAKKKTNQRQNEQRQKLLAKRAASAAHSSPVMASNLQVVSSAEMPALLREAEAAISFPGNHGEGVCPHVHAVSGRIVMSQLQRRDRSRSCAQLISCDPCVLHLTGPSRRPNPSTLRVIDQQSHAQRSQKRLWLCLLCGLMACGRECSAAHSHKHALRSPKHALAYNVATGQVWCYLCEDEVAIPAAPSPDKSSPMELLRLTCDLVICTLTRLSAPDPENTAAQKNSSKHQSLKKQQQQQQHSARQAKQASQSFLLLSIPEFQKQLCSRPRLLHCTRGLQNLGNTCFFNSVMQNILSTGLLNMYLLPSPSAEPRLLRGFHPPIGEGPLTHSLRDFFMQMWCSESASAGFNPRAMFQALCQKVPRFKSFQQQDAHESLRELLEGVQSEENRRLKKEWVAVHGDGEGAKAPPRELPTFVDALFGGTITSTITCHDCKTTSIRHESMLDLSIPIPRRFLAAPAASAARSSSPSFSSDFFFDLNGPGKKGRKAQRRKAQQAEETRFRQEMRKLQAERDLTKQRLARTGHSESKHQIKQRQKAEEKQIRKLGKKAAKISIQRHQSNASDEENLALAISQSQLDVPLTTLVEPATALDEPNPSILSHSDAPLVSPLSDSTLQPFTEVTPVIVETTEVIVDTIEVTALANPEISSETCAEPLAAPQENIQASVSPVTSCPAPDDTINQAVRVDLRRNVVRPESLNIEACLFAFTLPELLSGENSYGCSECTRRFRSPAAMVPTRSSSTQPSTEEESPSNDCSAPSQDEGATAEPSCAGLPEHEPAAAEPFDKRSHYYFGSDAVIELKASYGHEDTPSREPETPDLDADVAFALALQEELNREVAAAAGPAFQAPPVVEAAPSHSEAPCVGVDGQVVIPEDLDAFRRQWEAEIISAQTSQVDADAVVAAALADDDGDDDTSAPATSQPAEVLAEVDYSSPSSSSESEEEDLGDLVATTATKQFMLHQLPRVLTVHIKRFAHTLAGLRKLSNHVQFPLEMNLAGYCDTYEDGTIHQRQSTRYHLNGIVQHSGSLTGGHYIAYVRSKPDQWYYYSDSSV